MKFDSVNGDTVTCSFSGAFVRYDGVGGESPGQISASGSGLARLAED